MLLKFKRDERGSLVSWLLILFIFGLMFILTLISLEMLVKTMTLHRIEEAAQSASLNFARDIIKLRDNDMGTKSNYNLPFEQSAAKDCKFPSYSGCTTFDPSLDNSIQTDFSKSEYISASQLLLFNIMQGRNSDPSDIKDIRQYQCYTDNANMRFRKLNEHPTCNVIGKVVSPITELKWSFNSGNYTDDEKDFCVEAHVSVRLDPLFTSGLFINHLPFIKKGQHTIIARTAVMKPNFKVDQNARRYSREGSDRFYNKGAQNYSAESIFIETCSTPAECQKQLSGCQITRPSLP